MKMRLISEAYKEIKEADHASALTLYSITRLVKEGTIPSVKIGRKTLIDAESIHAYLKGDNAPQSKIIPYGIRKVGG